MFERYQFINHLYKHVKILLKIGDDNNHAVNIKMNLRNENKHNF